MRKQDYQPGEPGDVVARHDASADRWTIVFVRELRHAPARVWAALTDPAQLRAWAPFDADRDLGSRGAAILTMAGGDDGPDAKLPSEVSRADAPHLLEYTWGDDLLQWTLEPSGTGTRLTLRHTLADRGLVAGVSAGWHICADVLEAALDGAPIGRIVAGDAMAHGWDRLNHAYASALGVPPMAVPNL